MIRVVIVDDEPMARSKLRRLLRPAADVEVVAESGDAEAALRSIHELRPDVLFLDIDLPGQSGLELARSLDPAERPWLVFATAYAEFALKAFEVEALDYLLKPFDAERVDRVLERVRARLGERSGTPATQVQTLLDRLAVLSAAPTAPSGARWATRLVVQQGHEMRMVRTEEIDWIGSADNYVEVHIGGESHLLRDTLQSVEMRLDPSCFSRIHRGSIVNLDRVASIRAQASGQLEAVLRDGTVLPVGRAYRDGLTRRWHDGSGATG
jgi:two-component system LytT family response regulator